MKYCIFLCIFESITRFILFLFSKKYWVACSLFNTGAKKTIMVCLARQKLSANIYIPSQFSEIHNKKTQISGL